MRRATAAVGVIVALVGADVASAQSGGGSGGGLYSATEKRAKKFVQRQAKVVLKNMPAVFPNARITRKDFRITSCIQDAFKRRRIECIFAVAIHERWIGDTLPATIRWCDTPDGKPFEHALRIRLRRSGQLRLVGGWKMGCELEEFGINLWNEYADDHQKYQPNVSEPTSYPQVDVPQSLPNSLPNDLLPAPSGAPAGPFPGPLSVTHDRPARRSAHRAPSPGDVLAGCFPRFGWARYSNNSPYYVAGCWWNVHSLPSLVFNQTRYAEWYYFAGYDAQGREIARLYWAGYY